MKKVIAGVDEVGRGSLVGPVFAATVIFKKILIKKKLKILNNYQEIRETYWRNI